MDELAVALAEPHALGSLVLELFRALRAAISGHEHGYIRRFFRGLYGDMRAGALRQRATGRRRRSGPTPDTNLGVERFAGLGAEFFVALNGSICPAHGRRCIAGERSHRRLDRAANDSASPTVACGHRRDWCGSDDRELARWLVLQVDIRPPTQVDFDRELVDRPFSRRGV